MSSSPGVRILETDANQRGDLFGRLMGDLFVALGYESPWLNVHKSGREIDLSATHRLEPRCAVAACKATAEPVGGGDVSRFLGTLDAEIKDKECVTGYLISLSGFTETAIGQEVQDRQTPIVMLTGEQVVNQMVRGRALISLGWAKEFAGRYGTGDDRLVLDPGGELLALVLGWVWAVYYTDGEARTHFALIHSDGTPLARRDADEVIASDRECGGLLHTLACLNLPPSGEDWANLAIAQLLPARSELRGAAGVEAYQGDVPSYPLRRPPVISQVSKQADAPYLFSFPKLDRLPVGSGPTVAEAREGLGRQIHFAFQRLIALEEYERSEADQALWQQLVEVIDAERYEARRPIIRRAVGRVVKLPADAGVPEASSGDRDWRVSWDPDERGEALSLDQVPPEFARLRPGQWFEALVDQQPDAQSTRRILYAQVRRPPARMSDEEAGRHAEERRYQGLPRVPTPPHPETGDEPGYDRLRTRLSPGRDEKARLRVPDEDLALVVAATATSQQHFSGCLFGDHDSQANYFRALEQMAAVPDDARQKLQEAREAVEKGPFPEADKRELVLNLLKLIEELGSPSQEAGRVKRVWNRIKEVAPLVASILEAAASLQKLLGG